MKKSFIIAFVLGAFLASCSSKGKKVEAGDAQEVEQNESANATTYSKVLDGSKLDWRASHLAGTMKRWGTVKLQEAEIVVEDNKVTNASILVDMSSITVDNFGDDTESATKLQGHLTSGDFFLVDSFPTSQFELTNLTASDNADYNSVATGNLTIKGVTKSIEFLANVTVSEDKVSIVSEDFRVDRRDWNLNYNLEGAKGVPVEYLVANGVGFTINVNIAK